MKRQEKWWGFKFGKRGFEEPAGYQRGKKGKEAGDKLENKSNEPETPEGILQAEKAVEGKEIRAWRVTRGSKKGDIEILNAKF